MARDKKGNPVRPIPPEAPRMPTVERRRPHLWAWLFLLVVAGGGFGASVWYAGGIASALELVTQADYRAAVANVPYVKDLLGVSTEATPAPRSKTETETGRATNAVDELFASQVSDQATMTALAEGRVRSVDVGTAVMTSDTATVPFTVEYTVAPYRVSGRWYFVKDGTAWRMTRPDVGSSVGVAKGATLPERSVVATAAQQQLSAQNQRTIADGILGRGFKTVSIIRVTRTPTGVAVDLQFSGGTWVVGYGRVALTRQVVAGKTYWFLSAIEQP